MDHVEQGRRFPGLVGLKMADEMPGDVEVGARRDLLRSFLDLVLAEIDLAGVSGRADGIRGKGFGDGDESDGVAVAAGPVGGGRNAFADAVQPGAKRGGIGHGTGFTSSTARAATWPWRRSDRLARASSRYRTRPPRRPDSLRSRVPYPAGNGLRRGWACPARRLRTPCWPRPPCRHCRGLRPCLTNP